MPTSNNRLSAVRPLPIKLALPLSLLLQPSALQTEAQAITFSFDFASTVPDELKQATQEAADLWSPLLKDDVIVKLRIDYSDLSEAGSVLGGVQPSKVKVKYEDYADALFKDAVSGNDLLGVNSLQLSAKGREAIQDYQAGNLDLNSAKLESKEFAFLMDGQFANGNGAKSSSRSSQDFLDNNGNNNNKHVQLTRAQAKALGLLESKTDKLDAVITINNNASWDFDRTDGTDANRFDAITVVQHEIGHALGIVSGVDTMDFLASTSSPEDIEDVEDSKFSYLTPIDFYRYSEQSAQQGVMDLTLGGSDKYFSLDGGQSAVTDEFGRAAYFSTGSIESQGDGYQGSHWKADENPLGIMNPLLQPGRSLDISELDLTLLDAVGWDLDDPIVERAAAVNIDWPSLNDQLLSDRQAVVDELITVWGSDIPELEAAINNSSSELDFKFQQKVQDKLDSLIDKLEKEEDPEKRSKETAKFYETIEDESKKRNDDLRDLPKDIYKIDEEVRKWLSLPTDKLSKEMEEADAVTINRLSNVVKALPADEQAEIELKIEEAAKAFSDEPNKLVQDLLDTSGPANPIGWSYYRWYWWWLEGEEIEDDFSDRDLTPSEDIDEEAFYYLQQATSSTLNEITSSQELLSFPHSNSSLSNAFYSEQSDAKDVPEPSSVLALFGIAAIGTKVLRSR